MDQDAAWKRLFAHPLVVRHLLLGFAPQVARLLDLDSLERLSASWVAATGEQRHGDMAWRAWYADGSGRSLVILIEFQSSADGGMTVRVLRYEGMAFDGLRRAKALDRDGRLRLLSVVIHSGDGPWTEPGAADHVAVDDDGEAAPPPPARYLLVDSRSRPQDDAAKDNIVAAALWLMGTTSPARAASRLEPLLGGLEADGEREAADAVADWFDILWPRLFGDADPATRATWRRNLLNKEKAMSTFTERVREWEADLVHQGMMQGLEQGLERQHAMLRRLAEHKFGSHTAEELARRLAGVSDSDALALVGERIVDCDTGAALLERFDNGRH